MDAGPAFDANVDGLELSEGLIGHEEPETEVKAEYEDENRHGHGHGDEVERWPGLSEEQRRVLSAMNLNHWEAME